MINWSDIVSYSLGGALLLMMHKLRGMLKYYLV